jgi:hypothetical protein
MGSATPYAEERRKKDQITTPVITMTAEVKTKHDATMALLLPLLI